MQTQVKHEAINLSYETPLHVAVDADNEQIVRILCERGANTLLSNIHQESVLAAARRFNKVMNFTLETFIKYYCRRGVRNIIEIVEHVKCNPENFVDTKFEILENDPMISNLPPWQYSDRRVEEETIVFKRVLEKSNNETLLHSCQDQESKVQINCDNKDEAGDVSDKLQSLQSSLGNIKERIYSKIPERFKEIDENKKSESSNHNSNHRKREKKKKFVKFWLSNPNGKSSKLYSFKIVN